RGWPLSSTMARSAPSLLPLMSLPLNSVLSLPQPASIRAQIIDSAENTERSENGKDMRTPVGDRGGYSSITQWSISSAPNNRARYKIEKRNSLRARASLYSLYRRQEYITNMPLRMTAQARYKGPLIRTMKGSKVDANSTRLYRKMCRRVNSFPCVTVSMGRPEFW